ncbi:MAG TPA: uroporphyrinogen-III synthase [Bryobacteraceae bacterium]|nr:uroporphyrinogen-III synthase [Bryobacteraceae bacterium]
MAFEGKRVLCFESRRAEETAELIRRNGGDPIVAPAMREVPLERNEEALRFGEGLLRGDFDMILFLTGVGTRQLMKVLATRFEVQSIVDALRRITIVARGPKPTAALREMQVQPHMIASEPNTWREIVTVLDGRPERRIAIQEYGRPSIELMDALRARGAEVTQVPVYTYEMPEDVEPLRRAVEQLAQQDGGVQVTMFTTGQQAVHLMQIAQEMGCEDRVLHGLRRSMIASIGPTTTSALADFGLAPDMEPSRPKLGFLVKEAAEQSAEILCKKTT